MTGIAFLCALIGLLLLGLSTDLHHQRRFGTRPAVERRRQLRIYAWLALALSFLVTLFARGPVFGPVVWAGSVMLAAGVSFLSLNLLPQSKVKKP